MEPSAVDTGAVASFAEVPSELVEGASSAEEPCIVVAQTVD